jgi:predicted enzyme related to lactoylglutathione lyase
MAPRGRTWRRAGEPGGGRANLAPRGVYVDAMAITYVFAGIPVADLDAAIGWYERLAGRPPDLLPNDEEACWQMSETGWIYVIADAARAGSALITLLVDDLDAFLSSLAQRRITAGPVEPLASNTRRAIVVDPDGNRLQLGQPPA